jgi:DNA-binding XRE family transcriptional regulator
MTLKELRESHAMTQLELAYKCGVSINTIVAWEKGTSQPRLTNVRELAGVFNVSIAEINAIIADTEKQAKS